MHRGRSTIVWTLAIMGAAGFMKIDPVAAETGGGPVTGSYTPGAGFLLAKSDQGEMRLKIYSYLRYLNQKGLDKTYTDAFGRTFNIDRRQDIHYNKLNIQFMGWLMKPEFRYLAYVWTANTSQGQVSQVVVGGNLNYTANEHITLGGGIGALPGTRTTEGTFPFWLTLDNRLIADEFFRPSYTMGIWASGKVVDRVRYQAMLGNNLSQFGVDAGQLDDELSTFSAVVQWFPTTGEFGKRGGYGDFDQHEAVATRLGAHFTISDEDRQGQPNTEGFENVQIRLSDGSVIFQPGLFGPGILVDGATYHMFSLDGGVKWRGWALEGEYYWRLVNGFQGPGTETLDDLQDNGFQVLASAVVAPMLQLYASSSTVFGEYGDPWDARFGLNWFPWNNTVLRWNFEYLYIDRCPVGGLSLPYVVGGTGSVFQANLQVDF